MQELEFNSKRERDDYYQALEDIKKAESIILSAEIKSKKKVTFPEEVKIYKKRGRKPITDRGEILNLNYKNDYSGEHRKDYKFNPKRIMNIARKRTN